MSSSEHAALVTSLSDKTASISGLTHRVGHVTVTRRDIAAVKRRLARSRYPVATREAFRQTQEERIELARVGNTTPSWRGPRW